MMNRLASTEQARTAVDYETVKVRMNKIPKAQTWPVTAHRVTVAWFSSHWWVACWICAIALATYLVPAGCHSMSRWVDDGCWQQVRDDGMFEVMEDVLGPVNRRVGIGDTPQAAWDMASRSCGPRKRVEGMELP